MEKLFKKLHYYIFIRQSKWNYLIIFILVSPLFGYIFYKQSPIKDGQYTIAYATKMYWPVISYKRIEYNYNVKGKNYEATNIYALDPEVKIPARYLVQFSLEDHSFSTIYPNIPIPDSIKSAPAEGWKELPEWAKGK
ncbi:citrate synthase I [Chryseobacterium sp. StRB126]|uniref:hypothetical protein n=1 Tax=Chryseobacterium sp. StRB126 TaxID=878220 RepID=UPI0004E98986|nr:hypothetical protein [Chryseobacterium sp. StRB126]BAP32515.1 citrate synthase I [Chryseobacterium sp. StRB126]